MKVREIDEKEVEGFKPFTLAFTFENEGEARLMWHVFNHTQLWKDMSKVNYGRGFIKPAPNFIPNSDIVQSLILDHVRVKAD